MTARSGSKTIPTPGQAERLVTEPTFCPNIRLFAIGSNTTAVYIGDSRVVAVGGAGKTRGTPLLATGGRGDYIVLHNVDLSTVWLDAETEDEGVEWGPSYD
jgi:hypothetical protein